MMVMILMMRHCHQNLIKNRDSFGISFVVVVVVVG